MKKILFVSYTWFIIVLSILSFLCFIVEYALEAFNSSSNFDEIISCAHSFVEIFGIILALCCTVHIVVLLFKSMFSKERHSFIWLLLHQAFPLAVPLISFLVIRIFQGSEIISFKDLFCGILAGLISTILIMILDRRHDWANDVLSVAAPEYLEKNDTKTKKARKK